MFNFTKKGTPISLQADTATMVSANDSTSYTFTAGQVYVGVAGTVALITVSADNTTNATAITFAGVPAGTILPVLARRIISTGTTATGFVILS